MTVFHYFTLFPEDEKEVTVSLYDSYDSNIGTHLYEMTINDGSLDEIGIEEDDLQSALEELVEDAEDQMGETTINVNGKEIPILFEIGQ